ncbi:MAG TPA: 50S ribosomal protein L18 [Candidatus Saccharimonadales bacterium]|nr:50S ribosomal protein L18 [Candidatus Saccharimonadales bacterium]
MNSLAHKLHNRQQRKRRIRSVISGTAQRPRLSVYISNTNVSVQLIDDATGKTMAAVTSVGQKSVKGTMSQKAEWAGTEIANQAKTAKIKSVVFDRGGKLYHGRVAVLAEAARKAGLEF